MRWYEIVSESDLTDKARNDILDILAPLRSQGVSKITVSQVLDNLKHSPDLSGIDLDADFVMNASRNLKLVSKIEADPEAQGAMTMYLNTPVGTRQVDAKTAEKEKSDIKRAAMRTLSKKASK